MDTPDINMIRSLAGVLNGHSREISAVVGLDEEQRNALVHFLNWIEDHGLEYALWPVYFNVQIFYRMPGMPSERRVMFYLVASPNSAQAEAIAKIQWMTDVNLHERYIKYTRITQVMLPTHGKAIEVFNGGL